MTTNASRTRTYLFSYDYKGRHIQPAETKQKYEHNQEVRILVNKSDPTNISTAVPDAPEGIIVFLFLVFLLMFVMSLYCMKNAYTNPEGVCTTYLYYTGIRALTKNYL